MHFSIRSSLARIILNNYLHSRKNVINIPLRQKATLIDGKKIASDIQEELRIKINNMISNNLRVPHLVLLRLGNDPASATYVRNKIKVAEKIGIKSTVFHLPEDTKQSNILEKLAELNNDPTVDGILVQLPLPPHVEEKTVCNAVSPEKDVDGFHIVNIGRFCLDMSSMGPCTPLGILELIRRHAWTCCY